MSVTSDFLKNQNALLQLNDLNSQFDDIKSNLDNIQGLADSGVLPQSEVDDIKSSYKTNLNNSINKIISSAQDQANMIAGAAETEVYDKVKGATPVIDGIPVMANPTIEASAAAELSFLNNVPSIADSLTSIINNFNSILS